MKRQTSQQRSARRREAANLAHDLAPDLAHDLVHRGWTQAASASHLNLPQGAVSRDLAAMREICREYPVAVALMRIKRPVMRIMAHKSA
jgi:hypothetical protein